MCVLHSLIICLTEISRDLKRLKMMKDRRRCPSGLAFVVCKWQDRWWDLLAIERHGYGGEATGDVHALVIYIYTARGPGKRRRRLDRWSFSFFVACGTWRELLDAEVCIGGVCVLLREQGERINAASQELRDIGLRTAPKKEEQANNVANFLCGSNCCQVLGASYAVTYVVVVKYGIGFNLACVMLFKG